MLKLLLKKLNLPFDPIEFKLYNLHTGIYPASGQSGLIAFLQSLFDQRQNIAFDLLHVSIPNKKHGAASIASGPVLVWVISHDSNGVEIHH